MKMRTMTWEEIAIDWMGLQKRHRMEIGQAVARYCVGHRLEEVSNKLGFSIDWGRLQLDYAGISAAIGESNACDPLTGGSSKNVNRDVTRLLKEYAPTKEQMKSDDYAGYQDHYETIYGPGAVAERLARAEWAAVAAIEAGVLKQSTNKQNKKINQILFPDEQVDDFDLNLKFHLARVKSATQFLDKAKMNCLRRKSTCEKVAAANEAWFEQVERVLNLHPTFQQ